MSYTIRYSDPSKFNSPIIIQDNTKYNSVGTGGITLVGRDFPGYGQAVAENFIHILENSASPVPPINPIEGQLWFDTSDPNNKKLRINDGSATNTTWRPINGLHQQDTEPTQAAVGDIWVDTVNSIVYVYNTDLEFTPVGNQGIGANTGAFPAEVEGTDGTLYKIIVNRVNGTAVSVISANKFTPVEEIFENASGEDIQAGVTLSPATIGTTPRLAKFYGTAKSADALNQGTEEVSAVKFVRNDINQTINAQLRIRKDDSALQIGESPTFVLSRSSLGDNAIFNNEFAQGSFVFNIKPLSGLTTPILTMGGTDRSVKISSLTNSNSAISGALQVSGGVGIGRNLFVGDTLYANKLIANGLPGINGQILLTDGTNIRWSDFNTGTFFTGGTSFGDIKIESPTPSASSTSGALTVTGGVGIVGEVNIGSTATATSSTGALRVAGGVSIGGGLYVQGEIIANQLTVQLTTVTTTLVETDDIIQTKNTTTSIGTTTGALVVAGGVGIGGNLNIGGIITAPVFVGTATTSTNIAGGATGSIPVQTAAGITGFILAGTTDQFLRSSGSTAAFVSTSTMYVDSAVRAERFRTPRAITFTGDVTGSFSLDGTQNTGTALTIQPNSIELGVDTVGGYISTGTTTGFGISGSAAGEGTTFNVNSNATSTNDVSTIVFRNNAGSFAANNITAAQFNGNAQGLTNIPGLQIDVGSVRNSSLTSSTVGFVAGTGISISTASVALGDSITITSTGVTTLTGSSHLAVSTSSGAVTITNNGVRTLTGSAFIAVSTSTGTVTITNNGVQSIAVSGAIGVSASTGTITITDVGVHSITGSDNIAVSTSTGTVTITNNGVRTLTGSAFIAVSTSTGTVTITNNGVQSITSVGAIGVSTSTGTIVITDMGVRSILGSPYIAVSTSTGTVTIANNGVQTVSVIGALGVNQSTGTVTITDLGVQSLGGTTYLGVSDSTGSIVLTNLGVQSLSVVGALGINNSTGTLTLTDLGVRSVAGSTYIGVSASTGSVTITNLGVQTLTAGTDTSVSAATGIVTVWNNSTLDTVTARGNVSSTAIQITSSTSSTSVVSGALTVAGGVGIGGALFVGGNVNVTSGLRVTTTSTFTNSLIIGGALTVSGTVTLDGATQNLGSTTTNTTINLGYGATTSGNVKTVNIGSNGSTGSNTFINIGSPLSANSSTIYGDLSVTGNLLMQGATILWSVSTVTATLFVGTPTGSTVYFTDLTPPKLGIYGASAWRDAIGNILF
jgi:trimeric autotransporter adhesin